MNEQFYKDRQVLLSKTRRQERVGWMTLLILIFLGATPTLQAQKRAVVNINTAAERKPISPFIYGTNDPYSHAGSKRMGGNRLTNYNWENNASNAGRDWYHESDNYVPWQQGVTDNRYDTAGEAIKSFHERSLLQNAYSLVTLPLAGYVARDKNGAISAVQSAPSQRWTSVEFRKPASLLPFRLQPDLTDNAMYVDELLHYLLHNFGQSNTSRGIKGYSLDNEPGLWFDTHSRLWGHTPVSVKYLMEKSISLASLIKEMDPMSEVFGPASWGITEFENLQFAPDWDAEKGNYPTFIDLYLGRMHAKEQETGTRLLDVLDVHWYPQGNNNGVSPFNNSTDYETNKARMEMTRSLWDPTYIENTWIGNDPFKVQQFLPFIPKMHQHIDQYYPGTKLGITEYSYMGMGHASGGIAQADALGIFGKQGLYFANYWGAVTDYIKVGFDLFRNYDGKGGKFGSTSILSETNDINSTSVHASIEGDNDSLVHVIAMNKNQDSAVTVTINLSSTSRTYRSAKVWAFDNSGAAIRQLKSVRVINGNSFEYSIPPVTACHLVLSEEDISGYPDIDSVGINSPAGYSDGTASFELTVKVFDGNNDLRSVMADLRTVGGVDSVALSAVANEPGTYQINYNLPAGVTGGAKTIHVYAIDSTGRSAFSSIGYRVITKTQPRMIWEGDSITRGTGNVYFDVADSIARGAYIRKITQGGNQQPGSLNMHFVHDLNRYNMMTFRLTNNDNPADAVNISDYGAIEFYIRSNAPSLADIEVSLRDASAQLHTSSSVALKRDGYLSSFNKDKFTRVRIPLSSLTRGSEIKLDQVWQINFLSNGARNGFDVWIDDIRVIPYSHPVLQPVIDTVTLSPDKGYANGESAVTVRAKASDPDQNLGDVTIDFSSIGGISQQVMQLQDGWYTATSTVSAGLLKGDKQLWITATDADGNSVSSQVRYTVLEKANTEVIWDGDTKGSGAGIVVVNPSTIVIDSTAGNKGPLALSAYMNMGTVGFSSVHWDWNENTGDTAMRDLSTKGYLSFQLKTTDIKPGNDIEVFMKDRFGASSSSVSLRRDGYLTEFTGSYQQVRIPMSVLLANGEMDARQVTRIGFIATRLDSNGIRFLVDDIIAGGSNVADVRLRTQNAACGANGLIQVTGINGGGTLGYEYFLNGEVNPAGIGSPVFNGLAPGAYELAITGPNGFYYIETIEVNGGLNSLEATITQNNGNVDLTILGGSGPYNYQWSNGATTQDLSNVQPGTYTVFVSDAGSTCTVTATVEVVAARPGATATSQPANCAPNGSITVSSVTGSTGGLQYYINGTANPAGIDNPVFTALAPGSYQIEIRGNNNFYYALNAQVGGQANKPSIGSTVTYDNGRGFINLSVTGGTGFYTYLWNNGSTYPNVWYAPDGRYEVTVTDMNTGCTANAVFNLVVPSVSLSTQQPNCGTAASISVTATSGLNGTLRYYINDQPNPAGINSSVFTNLTAGTYTIKVKDENEVEVSANAVVQTGYGQPVIQSTVTYDNGRGFINLQIQGGSGFYNYVWSNGSTYPNVWYAADGLYEVEVIDIVSGCSTKASFTLLAPGMTLSQQNLNCGNAGSIKVESVTGIAGELRYYLNGVANPAGIDQPEYINLTAGNYLVRVEGAEGKFIERNVTIQNGVPAPQVTATITYNNGRGYINTSVTGGSGIYTYLWTGGSTFGNLWDVLPGTYEVVVTDLFSKCVVKASFQVQLPVQEATAAFSTGKLNDDATKNNVVAKPLVYPNPTAKTGQVRVRFDFAKYGIQKLVVRNAAGVTVRTINVPAGKQQEIALPVQGLKSGTYTITLVGKQVFSQQLLIME